MVRFDFNASPDNDESARFVVSALWHEGKQVHFVLRAPPALPKAAGALWRKTLAPWGTLKVLPKKGPRASADGMKRQTLTIAAAAGWLPMARSLAADAGYPDAQFEAQEELHETIVFTLAPQHEPPPTLEFTPKPTIDPQAPAKALPKAPPSRYLQDFKVP